MDKTISPRLKTVAIATCVVCCPLKLVPAAFAGVAAVSSSGFDLRLPLILTGWTCIAIASYLMLRTSREMSVSLAPAKSSKPKD